jgi:hypothetical protein
VWPPELPCLEAEQEGDRGTRAKPWGEEVVVDPVVVLYDLQGKPYEIENVVAAAFYPDHFSFSVEKNGDSVTVWVPFHRLYEVRSQ